MNIKDKIIEENAIAHDGCAEFHDRAVPYISRRSVRNNIWKLIEEQLGNNQKQIKGSEVLELGCGTGTFLNLADKRKAASYTGLDVSSEMLKLASKKKTEYVEPEFILNDLESFSQNTPQKYDVILASSFLHHLYDLEEGLNQIKSMLVEGGIFICLHEEINRRSRSRSERLSKVLALLSGNEGYARYSFCRRIMMILEREFSFPAFPKLSARSLRQFRRRIFQFKISSNVKIIRLFGITFVSKVEQSEGTLEPKIRLKVDTVEDINWVDYQLNGDYDLEQSIASKFGNVIPYCYYEFEFFKIFNDQPNHHIFVMVK